MKLRLHTYESDINTIQQYIIPRLTSSAEGRRQGRPIDLGIEHKMSHKTDFCNARASIFEPVNRIIILDLPDFFIPKFIGTWNNSLSGFIICFRALNRVVQFDFVS